jgi:hypothetical protein
MIESTSLELRGDFAVFRPLGTCPFPQAVQLVASAIAQARQAGIGKLLVIGTGVSGFDPPSIAERHQMAREWADVAQGRVSVAMVVDPVLIDPEKFAISAARNFGLIANVFEREADAVEWLKQPH